MNKQAAAISANELLQPYRLRLDSINTQLLDLLAQRMGVCMDIARLKARENIPMMQPARVSHVLDTVRDQACALGLDPEYVVELFRLVIDETCRQETVLINCLKLQEPVQ